MTTKKGDESIEKEEESCTKTKRETAASLRTDLHGWTRFKTVIKPKLSEKDVKKGRFVPIKTPGGFVLKDPVIPNEVGLYEIAINYNGTRIPVYLGRSGEFVDGVKSKATLKTQFRKTLKIEVLEAMIWYGCSIEYRYAAVTEQEKSKTTGKLISVQDYKSDILSKYDYAFNQAENGKYRYSDIGFVLEDGSSINAEDIHALHLAAVKPLVEVVKEEDSSCCKLPKEKKKESPKVTSKSEIQLKKDGSVTITLVSGEA